MATLTALYTLAITPANLNIGRMAMIQVSLGIVSEARQYTTIEGEQVELHATKHQKRHDLAVKALNDPDYWTPRFVFAALALDQPTGYTTDALIIQAVTTVFDKIAGVDIND